jgi:hypothetical protein
MGLFDKLIIGGGAYEKTDFPCHSNFGADHNIVVLCSRSAAALFTKTGQSSTGRVDDVDGQMMEQCRQHCEAASKSLDGVMKTVANAKQPNDPAKMRAALDSVEKPLTEMKEHMNMCMSMMKTMGDMHMSGQSDKKSPPKK